jgi:DNA-binding SARP family transcriptional activator
MAVVEDGLDVSLALGRHRELVPALTRLVGEHPADERLCERLMLALYCRGRQVEALETFSALRARLHRDFGVEPGASVRELQRRVLAQDPGLAGRHPRARGLPTAV